VPPDDNNGKKGTKPLTRAFRRGKLCAMATETTAQLRVPAVLAATAALVLVVVIFILPL
jgi:hypothetical protein